GGHWPWRTRGNPGQERRSPGETREHRHPVVDKTGTLTEGKPQVESVVALPGHDESRLVSLAASLERASEHPLGQAIIAAANVNGIALHDATDFHYVAGKGIRGKVNGQMVAVGNEKLFQQLRIITRDLA